MPSFRTPEQIIKPGSGSAPPPRARRRKRRLRGATGPSARKSMIKRPRLVPSPPPRHAARRHVETVDRYRSLGCSWLGFSSHSRKEVYRCIATYWLSRIVTRAGRAVASHREKPRCFNYYHTGEHNAIQKIVFHYREAQGQNRTAASNNHETKELDVQLGEHFYTWESADFQDKEFHQLVELFSRNLLDQAERRAQSFPDGTTTLNIGNNVLSQITVFRRDMISTSTTDAQSGWWFSFDDIENYRVAFAVTRTHKIQNVTPVVRNGVLDYDPTTLGAVAISGKIYESDRPSPRVQQRFADAHPDYHNLYDQAKVDEDAVGLKFTALRTPTLVAADGTVTAATDRAAREAHPLLPVFSQPVITPSQIWKGITGTSSIYMAPGGYHTVKRVFTYTGKLKAFVLGISGRMAGPGSYDSNTETLTPRTTTGECTFMCLEPAIRFADHSKDPLELVVNSEYEYELNMFEPKPYSLPRFNNVMVGPVAPILGYDVEDEELDPSEYVGRTDANMADRNDPFGDPDP